MAVTARTWGVPQHCHGPQHVGHTLRRVVLQALHGVSLHPLQGMMPWREDWCCFTCTLTMQTLAHHVCRASAQEHMYCTNCRTVPGDYNVQPPGFASSARCARNLKVDSLNSMP